MMDEEVILYMNADEILKLLQENGIIDKNHMQDIMNKEKKKYVMAKHDGKIWEGKDAKWYTYIQTTDGERKLRKRKSESELYNYLYDYYKEHDIDLTFRARFFAWVERQKVCGVSDNTIHKYNTDYKRFFESSSIEQKEVTQITKEDLEDHFSNIIESTKAPRRSIKCAFGYVNGMFEKCFRDKYIKENPCALVDLKLLLVNCSKEKKRKEENRWIKEDEMKCFLDVLQAHINNHPAYIQNYAVYFSIYTGLRVGEISSLKWEDVNFRKQYIYIHSSQKFNWITKEFYNSDTKNHQERVVPLVDNAILLLQKVKEVQQRYGIVSEFVFANEDGQITTKAISECVRRRCRTAKIPEKSIHTIRRTLNSNLRGNGTPVSIASSIMGHSEDVNKNNYTEDLASVAYRKELMQEACHY